MQRSRRSTSPNPNPVCGPNPNPVCDPNPNRGLCEGRGDPGDDAHPPQLPAQGDQGAHAPVPEHGQRAPWAAPQLGSCASLGRTWRPWTARDSQSERPAHWAPGHCPGHSSPPPFTTQVPQGAVAHVTAQDHAAGHGTGTAPRVLGARVVLAELGLG
eukprot:scaffold96046_cov45-Phaeocystis_antarctica.AAC.3